MRPVGDQKTLGLLDGGRLLWRLGRQSVDPPQWFLGVCAASLSVLLWVIEPWIGKTLIDLGLRDREYEAFVVLLGTGGALAAIAFGFDLSSRWLLGECERRTSARLHLRWSGIQLESHSLFQMEARQGASTLHSLPRQSHPGTISSAAELICSVPARSISACLQLLLISGVLSHFRPWLGVIALGGWCSLFFVSYGVSQRFAASREVSEETRGRRDARARRLWVLRDWLRFGRRSDQGIRSLAAAWESWRAADGHRESWESALSTVQWGGTFLLSFSLAIFCGFKVIQGELSLGEYVAIQVYLGLARAPVERLSGCWKVWASARNDLRVLAEDPQVRLFEQSLAEDERVLERDPSVLSDSSLQSLAFARSLRLQSTRFWDGEIELDGVMVGKWGPYSIRIPRGSRTLILPPEGALFSEKKEFFQTFRELLAASRPPAKGTIRVGGRDLREMPQAWIRRWSATLHREPVQFSGTLKEQVLLDFLPSRSAQELQEWLQRLELPQWALDDWLHPEDLSMEDRQKVELARVFLQKPGLLLLEENLPLWSLPQASRWGTLLREQSRTLLAFGESPHLLSWVDSVWAPQVDDPQRVSGQFAQATERESFLRRGDLSVFRESGGLLVQALESRSLEAQWRSIQKRFELVAITFEVQLQGDPQVLLEAFPVLLEVCRKAFRGADLAAQSSFRSFRLICLGADANSRSLLFERLFGVLSLEAQRLRTEGKGVVTFLIRESSSEGGEESMRTSKTRALRLASVPAPLEKGEGKTG